MKLPGFKFFRPKNRHKTAEGILDDYCAWLLSRGYSKKTISIYQERVKTFLKIYDNPLRVTNDDIQLYLSELHKKNLSTSYFLGHFYSIKNFFTYLRHFKKSQIEIDRGLLMALKPLRTERKLIKIIPNDDLSALLKAPDLKALRGCRDYAIMLFLLHGLRALEICTLTTKQVFIDGWGPNRKMMIDVKGKGRKERRIVMERSGDTEWAWNRYQQMRMAYNTNLAFPALLGKGQSKQLTTNGLYKILSRYAQKAAVSTWRPHLWRHTAAVKMIEDGVTLLEVQERLGHESVSTTEKYLKSATISQNQSANSNWIHKIPKADRRFKRWRLK